MKDQSEKNAGISLILSSSLMVVTMVLHPSGGSVEHLLRMTKVIVISHSLAILAIPFSLIGFKGITNTLGRENFFSSAAFPIILFGLVAVLGAACVNGLALPIFVRNYQDASPAVLESIKPVLKYNTALNHAFDFVYMGALCLAILFWSVAILSTKKLPLWLGYLGMALVVLAIITFASGFVLTSLYGFRFFIAGSVIWIISAGVLLMRKKVS